jgi:hypothetical protein
MTSPRRRLRLALVLLLPLGADRDRGGGLDRRLLVGLPAALAFNLVIDRFIEGLTGASDQ